MGLRPAMTPRIFLDASVLFAAAYSPTGAARELLRLALEGDVVLFTNQFAADETTHNLGRKAPEAVSVFQAILTVAPISVNLSPDEALVRAAAVYVELKDAPIVAGAIAAEADYLATFDKQHLLSVDTVAEQSGLVIATPGDILARLRAD